MTSISFSFHWRDSESFSLDLLGPLGKSSLSTFVSQAGEDGQIALLEYTFAGVKHPQTLYEYLQSNSLQQKKSRTSHQLLHEIFQILHEAWWGKATISPPVQGRLHYDRFLPVNLQVGKFVAPVSNALTLDGKDAEHCNRASLANLARGQAVCLLGWTIEKQEDSVLTIYTEPRDEPRLRIQLIGGQGQPEQPLAETYGYIQATRRTLLAEYAQTAIPTFDINAPHFQVDGQQYDNPLYYRHELLDGEPYQPKISIIHGDLNLRNILLEEEAKTKRYWVIDFATTGEGLVLLDFQWLETQVILWLLVPLLQKAKLGVHTLVTVLEALHKGEALPWRLRYKLRMPFAILNEIRQRTEEYLAEPRGTENRWQEYYRGLTLTLLGTLKQQALQEELGPDAKKSALIGAATTLRWSNVKLPTPPASTKLWLHYSVAGLLCLALGSGLTYGVFRSSLKPTSILNEVKQRKFLKCGVNGDLPLFGWDAANPKHTDFYQTAEGFDADFCRVVAIAIFGAYTNTVQFKNLSTQNRFQVVADRGPEGVDVFFRNSTRTPDREGANPADFDAVNFYARQGYMIRLGSGISELKGLAGKEVCVLPNSAPYANLAFLFEKGIKVKPKPNPPNVKDKTQPKNSEMAEALKIGYCDAWASDIDQILAYSQKLSANYSNAVYLPLDQYPILPDPDVPLQPRGPVVPADDSQWRKVVSYAVWATIYAEELGITQEKANSANPCADASSLLVCKQFLGIDDPRISKHIGDYLGLPKDFALNIIKLEGNYGEIYARHLRGIIDDRGPNQVHTRAHPEGLLFAPPFVLSQLMLPTPMP